jgi:hypothetical protein
MPTITAEHRLLNSNSIQHLAQLYKHIDSYERSVASFDYAPVESPKLMEPLSVKQAFDPSLFDDRLFFELFDGMSANPEHAISGLFRVYINGMLSPRYENEVLYTKPLFNEGFEAYLSRATGGHKFGIVINGAEHWSDTLARLAARIFPSIIEAQGVQRSTVEVTLFIGNYGYTPFGIHIDDPYTSVVHFHAGPAAKEMTLFDKEEFHRLNGTSKNCFEPQKLLNYGRTFVIEAGDVFLLPPHYYHIGNTEKFSVGIAFAVSKYPATSLCKQVLQYAINAERMTGTVDQLIDQAHHSHESLANWLRRARNELMAQASSRRHLRYAFLRSKDIKITSQQLWIRDPDFPLTQIEEGNDLLLFARGNRIRLSRSPLTRRLLAALPYQAFNLEQLHCELCGSISIDALAAFVLQLARAGGIHLVTQNTFVATNRGFSFTNASSPETGTYSHEH